MDLDIDYDPTRYRGFYVLLDPLMDAKIPQTWVECFGERVDANVLFLDSYKNSFNILLSKNKKKIYFMDGIEDLMHLYDIPFGGWLRVFYLGGNEFQIHVLTKELTDAKFMNSCPNHYQFGWADEDHAESHYDSGPETEEWTDLESSDVHLYASHFTKNRKTLPAKLVRDAINPSRPMFCVLRDQDARRFYCEYQFGKTNNPSCTIKIGWLDFIKSNNLCEGNVIKLGIKKGDPSVIHAKVYPVEAAAYNQREEVMFSRRSSRKKNEF